MDDDLAGALLALQRQQVLLGQPAPVPVPALPPAAPPPPPPQLLAQQIAQLQLLLGSAPTQPSCPNVSAPPPRLGSAAALGNAAVLLGQPHSGLARQPGVVGWGGLSGRGDNGSLAGATSLLSVAQAPAVNVTAGLPDTHTWFQPRAGGASGEPDCIPHRTSESAQQKRKADGLETGSPYAAALPLPKRRIIKHGLACVQCNRSKVKCDGDRPCARCMIRGIAEACSSRAAPAADDADNDQANADKSEASVRDQMLEKGSSSRDLEPLAEASQFAECKSGVRDASSSMQLSDGAPAAEQASRPATPLGRVPGAGSARTEASAACTPSDGISPPPRASLDAGMGNGHTVASVEASCRGQLDNSATGGCPSIHGTTAEHRSAKRMHAIAPQCSRHRGEHTMQ